MMEEITTPPIKTAVTRMTLRRPHLPYHAFRAETPKQRKERVEDGARVERSPDVGV